MSHYNPARFDFVSIKLVVLAAQSGSLTAAARACNLVVPAASRRLKEIEKTLGEILFERHSRGLVPTAAGKAFVRHGLAMIQQMDALFQELSDLRSGVVRHIRLCASTAAINQFLPQLLANYAQQHPDIHVDVEEQVSALVVSSLKDGRADIAAYVEGPEDASLDIRHFRRDELVLILPARHALSGKTPISFDQTLDEPWISLNTGAALLQQQQQAAMSSGKTFKLRMQVRSFDAVGHLVASGLGVAMLPKAVALPMVKAMKLTWRPLSDDWSKRQLKLAVRPEADEAVTALRDFLCQS